MKSIQQLLESDYSSKDSSNRVYLSAAAIIANCIKKGVEIDNESITTLNDFMSGLRNRKYSTRQMPSGNGHEHEYESEDGEKDIIRLRIEQRETYKSKQARLNDPSLEIETYPHKELIICPKPTAFTPFNRLNIPSVRSASADPVYAGSPDKEVNRPSDVVEEVQF